LAVEDVMTVPSGPDWSYLNSFSAHVIVWQEHRKVS
jgi:hypothetical protein